MSVIISNAYSRLNSGDGLLVDLSIKLLKDVFPLESVPIILAADPESFVGMQVHASPAARNLSALRKVQESAMALCHMTPSRIDDELRSAHFVAAVGGGYLRFGHSMEAAKSFAAHLSQIEAVSRAGIPMVLLPQSIGPLRYARSRVLSALQKPRRIFLRDDISMGELSSLENTRRVPDLAVLEIARSPFPNIRDHGGRIGVILRDLTKFGGFEESAKELLAILGARVQPLVQSATGSNNDDTVLYRRLGANTSVQTSQGFKDETIGVVVSARLHGALEAILAGIPAIHLSYERKGFGAYNDLDLSGFVHNARTFDPEVVAQQALDLAEHPAPYWDSLNAAKPVLSARAKFMIEDIKSVVADR
jgi:polysaccharide pyruvyl transferase WcaK-like protein